MLDVTQQVGIETVWCDITESDVFFTSINWFLACYKFLETAKDC